MAVKYTNSDDINELSMRQLRVYPMILDGWALDMVESALEYRIKNDHDIFDQTIKDMKKIRREIIKQIKSIDNDYHKKIHTSYMNEKVDSLNKLSEVLYKVNRNKND